MRRANLYFIRFSFYAIRNSKERQRTFMEPSARLTTIRYNVPLPFPFDQLQLQTIQSTAPTRDEVTWVEIVRP